MPRSSAHRLAGPGAWMALTALGLALSGCAYTNVPPGFTDRVAGLDPAEFTCCAEPERFYPDPLVRAVLTATGSGIGPELADIIYGDYDESAYPGTLTGKPAAQAAVLTQLLPFDIVFVANKSYRFGRLIPGRFSHAYLYTGSEAELRAAGLWDLPAIRPYQDEIRAGRVMLEAVAPYARLNTLKKAMEIDAAAILRAPLNPASRRQAASRAFADLGKPYDYVFNVDTPDSLSCTELVNDSFPQLDLKPRIAYGQRVILPDDVVSQAIRGDGLRIVGYIVGTDTGFEWRNTHSLMADIAAYWGLPR